MRNTYLHKCKNTKIISIILILLITVKTDKIQTSVIITLSTTLNNNVSVFSQ